MYSLNVYTESVREKELEPVDYTSIEFLIPSDLLNEWTTASHPAYLAERDLEEKDLRFWISCEEEDFSEFWDEQYFRSTFSKIERYLNRKDLQTEYLTKQFKRIFEFLEKYKEEKYKFRVVFD